MTQQEINELIDDLVTTMYDILKNNEDEITQHDNVFKTAKSLIITFEKYKPLEPYIDEVVKRYEEQHGIRTFEPGTTLVAKKSDDSWLYHEKNNVEHNFQDRYRKYLLSSQGKGFGPQATDYIFDEAEKVLSLCADPSSNDKKLGLVMGDVQSGKTANYLALASMACDYGYNIILILSGLTETLRRQTQRRVDEAITGAVSSSIGNVAIDYTYIGKLETPYQYFAIPLTTDKDDFSISVNFNSNDLNKPQILVVKKNKAILERVKTWLKPGNTAVSSQNILIIDDECDNASVNTKNDDYNPTTINKLIRDIYNNFPCATYVGYTATPFANIYINPDVDESYRDLFPRDFIHRLRTKNEDYFGIDKVFRSDDFFLEKLDPDEPYFIPAVHKKELTIRVLPESLKNAICTFLICCCVRTLRGNKKEHRSMMINISRFNAVQDEIANCVWSYVRLLKQTIPSYDNYSLSRFCKHDEMKRIYDLFETSPTFTIARQTFTFKDIQGLLNSEIKLFQVRLYNNSVKKEDIFNYDDYNDEGARVIIVGGFALSRGLTLEGLMISYYNRNAEAYDTLLQMCRWFGYRPFYEDLCRIYMTDYNYDNFQAVIEAIRDLDTQFDNMVLDGKTPLEYGLMVKESPDILESKLLVTARNKSRHSQEIEDSVNLAGRVVDTTKLYNNITDIQSNERRVNDLVKVLIDQSYKLIEMNGRHIFKDIPKSFISPFVKRLKIPNIVTKFDPEMLSNLINENEALNKWDIVFATGKDDPNIRKYVLTDNNGNECLSIFPAQRSFTFEDGEEYITFYKENNRLIDPGILNAGLDDEQLKEVQEIKEEREKVKGVSGSSPIGADYLRVHNRNPLLIIVPMKLKTNKGSDGEDESETKKRIVEEIEKSGSTLIGFGIGIPGNPGDRLIYKYRANLIKVRKMYDKKGDEEDED